MDTLDNVLKKTHRGKLRVYMKRWRVHPDFRNQWGGLSSHLSRQTDPCCRYQRVWEDQWCRSAVMSWACDVFPVSRRRTGVAAGGSSVLWTPNSEWQHISHQSGHWSADRKLITGSYWSYSACLCVSAPWVKTNSRNTWRNATPERKPNRWDAIDPSVDQRLRVYPSVSTEMNVWSPAGLLCPKHQRWISWWRWDASTGNDLPAPWLFNTESQLTESWFVVLRWCFVVECWLIKEELVK